MKYIKTYKDNPDQPTELTREEAKELIGRYYDETECSFDEMLDMPGMVNCMFSVLEIVAE